MKQYQPVFIESADVKSLLKSLVPFFEEDVGRYWLKDLIPWEYDDNEENRLRRLKVLLAEGLNTIDEVGNLIPLIEDRKNEYRIIEENDCLGSPSDEFIRIKQNFMEKHTLMFFSGGNVIEMEIGLFSAWQKYLLSNGKKEPALTKQIEAGLREEIIRIFEPLIKEGFLLIEKEYLIIDPMKFKSYRAFFLEVQNYYKSATIPKPRADLFSQFVRYKKDGIIQQITLRTIIQYLSGELI